VQKSFQKGNQQGVVVVGFSSVLFESLFMESDDRILEKKNPSRNQEWTHCLEVLA
jgi:hypothetical protein